MTLKPECFAKEHFSPCATKMHFLSLFAFSYFRFGHVEVGQQGERERERKAPSNQVCSDSDATCGGKKKQPKKQ